MMQERHVRVVAAPPRPECVVPLGGAATIGDLLEALHKHVGFDAATSDAVHIDAKGNETALSARGAEEPLADVGIVGSEEAVQVRAKGRAPAPPVAVEEHDGGAMLVVSSKMLTVLLVLLAMVMVPGIILIYFAAVDALEQSQKDRSLLQSTDLSEQLNASFSRAVLTTHGIHDFFSGSAHDIDAMRATSVSEYLNTTVRDYLWATIIGSPDFISAENGVVLVPHDIEAHPEKLAYSHIWYDLSKTDVQGEYKYEFIYGYHHPSNPQWDGKNIYCDTNLIHTYTGRDIQYAYNFTCDGYLQIPQWNTTTSIDVPAVVSKAYMEYTRPRTARFRRPNIWFASGGDSYVFSAYEAFFEPPPGPHPWRDYVGEGGGILFQSYMTFVNWQPMVNNASRDGVMVYVYDKRLKTVYAHPSSDATVIDKSQTASCKLLRAQSNLGIGTCVPIADAEDQVGPIMYAIYKNGPAAGEAFDGTRFKHATIRGEGYYLRYTSVFRAVTRDAPEEGVTDEYDIVLAWVTPSSPVQAQVKHALKVMVGFSVGLIIMLISFHFTHHAAFAEPLARLTHAAHAMAMLDLEKSRHCVEGQTKRNRLIREIDQLSTAFIRILYYLESVVAYLPQGLMLGGREARSGPAFNGSTDPPRATKKGDAAADLALLGRLRDTGMHRRTGTVLAATWGGDCSDGRVEAEKAQAQAFVADVLRASAEFDGKVLLASPSVCILTWNVSCHCAQHEVAAVRCALQLAAAPGLRVALATGSVFAGTLGDATTRVTTCCGEPFEIAKALLPLTLCLGVGVLAHSTTWKGAEDVAEGRPVDLFQLGSRRLTLYEIQRDKTKGLPLQSPRMKRLRGLYKDAFVALCAGAYDTLERKLSACSLQDRQVFRLYHLARHALDKGQRGVTYLRQARVPWQLFESEESSEWVQDVGGHVTTNGPDGAENDTCNEAEELAKEILQTQEQLEHARQLVTPNNDFFLVGSRPWLGTLTDLGTPLRDDGSMPQRQDTQYSLPASLGRSCESMGFLGADGSFDGISWPPLEDLVGWASEDRHCPSTLLSTNQKEVWFVSNRVLGVGSFGRVYLGMKTNAELIALKVLPITSACTNMVKDLVNEVAVLSKLRHDNIVAYHGSALSGSPAGGVLVICMEYMPGGNLDELRREFGRFGETTVQRYGLDMLRGLAYLHSQGIMHRDLKPGNVLVGEEASCKLADFGSCAHISSMVRDTPGVFHLVGTVEYMAPEVVAGERHFASDLWAFALTLCELLDGKLPYPGLSDVTPSRETLIYRFAIGRPPMRPHLAGDMSAGAREVCAACFHESPHDRLTTQQLLSLPFFQ
eukprot:TRINITY_DN15686_c0_g1_i1.p1 TRINITY_DN15686_c0_g1~~TRINITY_DN15686_c0_g1_i1.p1  ORF type:complete len:1323 (+),score=406.38 TRINITY_DN15686_c0_g1_i1:73-4041(+)